MACHNKPLSILSMVVASVLIGVGSLTLGDLREFSEPSDQPEHAANAIGPQVIQFASIAQQPVPSQTPVAPIASTTATSIFPPSTSIPPTQTAISATSTPTAETGIGEVVFDGFKSFSEGIGSISGNICSVLIILGIIGLIYLLFIRAPNPKPELRLETYRIVDGQKTEHPALRDELQLAFARLRQNMVFIENFYFLDDQLKSSGLYDQLPTAATSPEGIGVKLSLGPVEIGGLERILRRVSGRKEFALLVTLQKSPLLANAVHMTVLLTRNNTVFYTSSQEVAEDQIDDEIVKLSEKVAWAMSQETEAQVEALYRKDPPEVDILHGIGIVARYLKYAGRIEQLDRAVEYFRKAGEAGKEWHFQAGLLEAITMQLSQVRPHETAERMLQLKKLYEQDEQKRLEIIYNLGQAEFYTYTREGYKKAIEYFQQIPRPPEISDASGHPVQSNASNRQYLLYCLAQANIAIVKAHQIHSKHDKPEGKQLEAEARALVSALRLEIEKNQLQLGPAIAEVEWRLYNVETMLVLNMQLDPGDGIRAAQQALAIAPYAHDVRANLGSLHLLKAVKEGGNIAQSVDFKEATQIFEELEKTGWDAGFVKFRLGTIRRVQGRKEEASGLLQQASDPTINDVGQELIEKQQAKNSTGDTSFTSDDI